MTFHEIKEHVECAKRNGAWGTCGNCPRNDKGVFPEACIYHDRGDHHCLVINLLLILVKRTEEGWR